MKEGWSEATAKCHRSITNDPSAAPSLFATPPHSELDATLGNFIGSNKSQWKGVSEAFEGRIGEVERMQTTIATEVASVRTGLEGLLGGGIGGVALEKSKFADAIFAKVEKMFEDRVGVVLEKILTDKAQKDKREEEVGGGSLRLELESCKKELARVGEELGKVKSGFKGDIERISVKADRNGKSIEDLAELNISDKDGASENDLALLKTEISSLEDTVKGLGEEIEGDRERSRAGQKTIGHAMVEMKEGVESVKSMLMQRGQEIEGIVREVKVLKDNEKKWMLGLGAVEKLGKLEKKLEVEKTGGGEAERTGAEAASERSELRTDGPYNKLILFLATSAVLDLALKKVADQMDKMSMTVSKLSVGMGREETERKESLEEVGLDLGVLKLKLGDVETGVGGYGGRIRVVEEEINVLKRKAAEVAVAEKKGAAVEKKKAHTVDDKLSVLQKRAAPSSPGRVLELSKNDDINDSFESDADELIHAANVERERKVGQKEEQAGLKSDVPVRKPKQVEEKPEAVKDEDDDFVTSCTSAPILGPLSSNYEVIEDIGFHRKSSIIGLGMVGGGDEASKVPRVGDRVKARWKGLRSWFKGVCIAVNDKNAEGGGGVMTWNVQYDDGAIDKFVKKDFIILDEDFYKGEGGKGGGSKKKDESASEGTTNAERKEKDELGESVKVMFPDHEFVKKWDAWHVREWIKSIVKVSLGGGGGGRWGNVMRMCLF